MVGVDDAELKRLLEESHVIAVVGCSRSPGKAAHSVPRYLQEHGYGIIPVNPSADEILGEKSYPSLSDIEGEVDVVDVFRPSEEAYDIVNAALSMDPMPKAVWLQQGIVSEEAGKLAEENNIMFVQDRCMRAEHRRLFH